MRFPQSFGSSNGEPPLIGQKTVPTVNFQIQVTPELMTELQAYAKMTGLDGTSLLNHVFTRGLVAIKQDYINAQIEADQPDPEEGSP